MNCDAFIDAKSTEMIENLRTLLRIPSLEGEPLPGAPFGKEVRNALDCALDLCAGLGLNACNVDGYAGYAEIPGATGEQIGVLTHLDVVPCGDGWKHAPFDAVVDDGVIYARGVCDDKGPLVASIYALAAIMQSGIKPKRNIRLIFGCNEESGWGCIKYYQQKIGLPDVGFSPDADYPIINTEKGLCNLVLNKDITHGEYTLSVSGGVRPNVVAPAAKAVITGNTDKLAKVLLAYPCAEKGLTVKVAGDECTIEAAGISAHASMPDEGKNSFFELFALLDKLNLGGGEGELISSVYNKLCFNTDGAKINGLACSDEISGALTMNLGMMSVQDGKAEIVIDIRYPICAAFDSVYTAICNAMPGFTVSTASHQVPHHTPEDHYLVRSLKKVYKQCMNREPKCLAIGGGTYARALKTGVAFGVTREGAEELAHNTNERMSIADLIQDAKIFAAAYEELLTVEQ